MDIFVLGGYMIQGTYLSDSDGSEINTGNSYNWCTSPITVQGGQEIKITIPSATNAAYNVCEYDNSMQFITATFWFRNEDCKVQTLQNNTKYVRLTDMGNTSITIEDNSSGTVIFSYNPN